MNVIFCSRNQGAKSHRTGCLKGRAVTGSDTTATVLSGTAKKRSNVRIRQDKSQRAVRARDLASSAAHTLGKDRRTRTRHCSVDLGGLGRACADHDIAQSDRCTFNVAPFAWYHPSEDPNKLSFIQGGGHAACTNFTRVVVVTAVQCRAHAGSGLPRNTVQGCCTEPWCGPSRGLSTAVSRV